MEEIKVTNMVKFYSLCLLYENPKHGYELIKTISERLGKKVSAGQIYPFLSKLEEGGLIKSGARQQRDKVQYSLTPTGKKFCQAMLQKFGGLIEIAIEPSISKCAHCACEVFKGGYKEKIGGKEISFCCEYCANSWKTHSHSTH
ncbi:MAG: PadR family transcriptional regulator [Candidatus Diapherotrites archaeon]|nr:PadR family transcriptional regulator [Candidatus Diapherotrites archaeon]